MKTVEFRSTRSPAHHVRTTGAKFVAGTLIVPETGAEAVRAYARTYPHFGIVEVIPRRPPAPPAPPTPAARRPRRVAVAAPVALEPSTYTPADPVPAVLGHPGRAESGEITGGSGWDPAEASDGPLAELAEPPAGDPGAPEADV